MSDYNYNYNINYNYNYNYNTITIASTRFVVKPEGVSNVFLTIFGGSMQTWGLRGTRGINPQPPTNRALTIATKKGTHSTRNLEFI